MSLIKCLLLTELAVRAVKISRGLHKKRTGPFVQAGLIRGKYAADYVRSVLAHIYKQGLYKTRKVLLEMVYGLFVTNASFFVGCRSNRGIGKTLRFRSVS